MKKIEFVNILGVPIARLRLKEISSVVIKLIEEGGKSRTKLVRDKKTIFYVNAHCFNIANKDPLYKKLLQRATLVYPDGTGPILASRILGLDLLERTPALDFIDEIFAKAERKKWSFYLLGGEEDVVESTVDQVKKRFPMLKIAGYHHGFFANNSKIVEEINRVKPDIVLVGMGPSKQEKWIAENKDKINARVFWAVGALFDVLSGKRKRGPKWIQRLGLEWIFRLVQEPRRLWKRYLFGNIHFLFTVFREREAFSHKTSR